MAGDDVIIDAPLNYVVTVAGAQSAQDVTLNSSGADLAIVGTLALGGTLQGAAGILNLASSGVLQGGTIIPGGIGIIGSGGTLDGVTLVGSFALGSAATLDFINGPTISNAGSLGTPTIDLMGGPSIAFLDNETLDNAVLSLATTTISVASGMTLTLGPNLRTTYITSGFGWANFEGQGGVLNRGTIAVPQGNLAGNIFFNGAGFDNEGVISSSHAYLHVAGAMSNNGLITTGGTLTGSGDLEVGGDLTGTGTIDLGTYLFVSGTLGSGQHIIMRAGSAVIADAFDSQITIDGFASGRPIYITGLTDDGNINAFWSGGAAGGTLTIKDGTITKAALFLTGIQQGATFNVAPDSNPANGTVITTNNIPCFATGTRVITPHGEIPVEHLKIGDHVLSAFGGTAPIQWIGKRTVDCARHPTPKSVWPIRIQAHALADTIPSRDLYLSPEHALHLDGHLIPAHRLVNGTSITQVPRQTITYWHLELPQHDLLLAEATPCESYLDTNNRNDFENADGPIALHPTFTADELWRANACAPQCRQGPVLDRIRARLNARAAHPRSAVA